MSRIICISIIRILIILDIDSAWSFTFIVKRAFDFTEISTLLNNIIGQKKNFNQQKMLESMVLVNINEFFNELLPELLINHMQVYKYHNQVLFIRADHGIYAQQLKFKTQEILEQIREHGLSEIKKIDIRIGKLSGELYKTNDIMSQNQKMSPDSAKISKNYQHENIDQINKLIEELGKIKK